MLTLPDRIQSQDSVMGRRAMRGCAISAEMCLRTMFLSTRGPPAAQCTSEEKNGELLLVYAPLAAKPLSTGIWRRDADSLMTASERINAAACVVSGLQGVHAAGWVRERIVACFFSSSPAAACSRTFWRHHAALTQQPAAHAL